MCGICGQYRYGDGAPVDPPTLRAMTDSLTHRGPDDEGYYQSGAVGLGFRRLSIIDLAGGHQPMADADGLVQVVFNGEIYNFAELRRTLEQAGHRFRTRSDTEVIVHGYKQWGEEVLGRLEGMFGLAIWDERRRRLILARDPAGIKLVYYHVDGQAVTFGSELRAVRAALPASPTVDPAALNLFLRLRYIPSPMTPYTGIAKLPPGSMAVFEPGRWSVRRWHRAAPPVARAGRPDDLVDELLDVADRALQRHLISDVPLGLLLSGGIDSGLLLGLMSRRGGAWPTYTAGYGRAEHEGDELADAAGTARHFGARHTPVALSREAFSRALPHIVDVLEEPVAASSVVPMYFVCARAREDVKVVLMGQGPDELFGGYTRHVGVRYGAHWRGLPGWLRRGLGAGIGRLPRNEALKRGVRALGTPGQLQRYQDVFSLASADEVDGLFRPGVLGRAAADAAAGLWRDLEPELAGRDELGAFQLLELRSSLPDELLMYADKLSMAHGLEVRVPYLDRELVDLAARLPQSLKVRSGQRKWLYRRACARLLPREVMQRRKRGFAVDAVDGWFNDAMQGSLAETLLDERSLIYGHLDPAAVRRQLDAHRARRSDNHKLLFSLVVMEQWMRAFGAKGA